MTRAILELTRSAAVLVVVSERAGDDAMLFGFRRLGIKP